MSSVTYKVLCFKIGLRHINKNYKRVGKIMKYDFTVLAPVLIAFGISVVLSPVMIPFLKKLKF